MKKTIVITGASSGIGAALARTLASGETNFALTARRETELNAVGADAERKGAGVVCIVADVTRRADVERIALETIARFGGFDVWVNNAGRGITRDVLDLTDEDVDHMIAVNLKSALYGMQVAARHFLQRDSGHIVNVSSFLGRVPMASMRSVYSASKAALNSLTANLRTDITAKTPNVHVTLVMPGIVATDFARNAAGEKRAPGLGAPPARVPVAQTAEEVAAVIAEVIRNPVPEVYTNPASAGLAKAYYADVGAFEAGHR